ncbi:hypothetical protein Tco_0378608 [Tanacetum coccineum]
MVYLRSLHSHLKVLSNKDLKGTHTEYGFKRAFISLFGQDVKTFTSTMLLNVNKFQKHIDKDEFQENESMDAFWTQEGKVDIIKALDDNLIVIESSGKESEKQVQALDANLVVAESSGTDPEKQDERSRKGNDTDTDDADIKPTYDEEPMAEVQLTAECNIFAKEQQHAEQSDLINERRVDQDVVQCQDKCPLLTTLTDTKPNEQSYQFLESENQALKSEQNGQFLKEKNNEAKVKHDIDVIETINIELEHSVAKLLTKNEHLNKENKNLKQTYKYLYDSNKNTRAYTKDQNHSLIAQLNEKSIENADLRAQIQEKVFANPVLKNKLRKLTGTSVDTKFAKPLILEKPPLQTNRKHPVVRKPTTFKSERPQTSKSRFSS